MPTSPSDGRLAIMRTLRALFLDSLAAEGSSSKQRSQDEQFADDLSAEILDVLGLQVVAVDDDGSMTVRITPESI